MKCMKEVLDTRFCQIDLRKVKSHATQEEMDMGPSSPILKHGNDRADHFAAEGAKIYKVEPENMNLVHMVDARTWMI